MTRPYCNIFDYSSGIVGDESGQTPKSPNPWWKHCLDNYLLTNKILQLIRTDKVTYSKNNKIKDKIAFGS